MATIYVTDVSATEIEVRFGGYDPEVRLEIVRGLLGNVDPMLHSLLARHLENIRDEARDFDKEALAEAAERLLRSLEPEATLEE